MDDIGWVRAQAPHSRFPQRFDSFGHPPICRSSSLGGQRIVYPTKASSILVYGAKANSYLVLMHGSSMFVSFNGCYRN